MSILEKMAAQHEAEPAWLNNIVVENSLTDTMFDAMLQSRVVFYPGSGCRDGLSFSLFTHTHAAHCVIHADVDTDLDDVLNAVTGIPGKVSSIQGYRPTVLRRLNQEEAREVLRLDEQPLPGLDDLHPMAQVPGLAGAVWSILERKADFGDEHGPLRLAFLHVKCEAAWLFWNLWLRTELNRPPPFAIIVAPEFGGSIERLFGPDGRAYRLEGGQAKRPDWIYYSCSDVNQWPGYEIANDDQKPRVVTLLRRLPDDHQTLEPEINFEQLYDAIVASFVRPSSLL
jgi:hypothetical protein